MIARLKSWLSGAQPTKLEIVRVESQKISLVQWRSQTASVGASIDLVRHPIYRAQRDILEREHPGKIVLVLGTTETDRKVHQARIEGYEMALRKMDLFSQPLTKKKDVEATFEDPSQPE